VTGACARPASIELKVRGAPRNAKVAGFAGRFRVTFVHRSFVNLEYRSPGYGPSLPAKKKELMLSKCIPRPRFVLGIAVAVAASASADSQTPGGAGQTKIVAESRFDVTDTAAQAELVQLVVDFAPGAWTSVHTHGGQAINLVLEGEITLRHGSHGRPYKAGQAWTDEAGVVHAAGNTGSGKARLLTNFLLPAGAPQITEIEPSRFGPIVLHQARFALPPLPAAAEIVQQVVDVAPGGRVARAHDGLVAVMVVDGELTMSGTKHTAGQAWFARPGEPLPGENSSPNVARAFLTYLVAGAASR